MSDKPKRRFVSLAEAAEYLSVSEKTIRRRIADGQLTGYQIGKGHQPPIRVDLNEIDEKLLRVIPTVGNFE